MEAGSSNRNLGNRGEKAAVDYLESCGYDIIRKNLRMGKLGEIDIIARESEYICFIEVKTRSSNLFGMPCESVDRRKQERIRRMALLYTRNSKAEENIRFDIVEVMVDKHPDSYTVKNINLIRNAF